MLDAILSPEWDCRYYSFNSSWGPGEQMASMRNGSGDDWFLLLDSAGAALKGFAHKLADDWSLPQNIQSQVPKDFSSFLGEPAFSMQHATFCYWRKANDPSWSKVSGALTDDGSEDMLALLVSGPSGYKEWAEDYFEISVALDAVVAMFSHQPLSDSVILVLNPEADLDFTYRQALQIGYPLGAAYNSFKPKPLRDSA
ncbi:hypothetical protein K8O61_01600 [Xanthomonas cerealis pv. cerealis]|uniref:hypothetical protein n=1 Tax=Xanthomonas translucens group TaxID=3390202 RepID=UPI00071B7306|nr:hypothetical protein [Xanthomonas translucens]UKE69809.1 hypothetical protein K8O61_01600 [Xanthomonas translucens pv. pistacia]